MATNDNSNPNGDKVSGNCITAELKIPSVAKGSSTAALSSTCMTFPFSKHNSSPSNKEDRSSTTAYYDALHGALLDAKKALNDTLTLHVDSLQTQLTPQESMLNLK